MINATCSHPAAKRASTRPATVVWWSNTEACGSCCSSVTICVFRSGAVAGAITTPFCAAPRGLPRGQKFGRIDWLDSLTVYKDRRAYPHKLANAIIAYDLTGKVQNSHRAIDDVLALFEVLKAMDDEREDLGSYVNLFGYNPKYGVSGRRIVGVRYEPQSFSKGLTRPEQTLPARMARR